MRFSEDSLDTKEFLSKLLITALKATKTGLFYSPLAAISKEKEQYGDTPVMHDPESAWSINVGPLFGMDVSPTDSAELLPFIVEEDRHLLIECVVNVLNNQHADSDCEYRIKQKDGEIRWLMSRLMLGLAADGTPEYLVSMVFDITDQKRQHEYLTESNKQLEVAHKLLRSALETSGIAIFRNYFDETRETASEFQTWNVNLDRLYDLPSGAQITPQILEQKISRDDHVAMRTKTKEALINNKLEFQHEFPVSYRDNSVHWLLAKCFTELNSEGAPEYVSGAIIDITERKSAEEKTKYIATHDVLTGLPNRFMFGNMLSHAIETAKRYTNQFAVLFIDLDRFKSINDALGHQAGDQLLTEISARFRKTLRASDIIARISGDEFVVMAPELNCEEDAAVVARKIIAEACKPVTLLGQSCQISASIGICIYPKHGENEQTLMKNADAAMYIAKEAGKNNYQFYNAENTSQSLERMAMENELRAALSNNELSLQYQAKLDLQSDEITGVEALLRWNNPKFGSVSPAVFIPMAEETGLIVPIGRWVLKTACQQNVAWQKQGIPPICVAVNISARQFMSRDLLSSIKEALEESGMDPQLLELEITESMVMHHVDKAVALLDEIKNLGARIAIDDFGTGYSSLAQLKRFPIDTLKVDRSFIREVAHDSEDQAITEAIIAMGKSLSLTIIAEGVETKEQQEFLRNRACDEMQGFYFSKPVPPSDFSELFKKHLKKSKH